MIVDRINEYLAANELTFDWYIQKEVGQLAEWSFSRQFMKKDEYDSTGKLHMSSIGKCERQLAYKYHGIQGEGKSIDGRARMNFFFGDLAELVLIKLAKLSGVPLIGTGQDQVRITLPLNSTGNEISGYPDGFLVDGREIKTVSIKSMPSFRFRAFEKGDIDDSYIAQANIEMLATGLSECVMVALCKDNGVFGERIIERSQAVVNKLRQSAKVVIKSTPKELPAARYEPNNKGKYPWQCLYCAHWKLCKPNAQKVLKGKNYELHEPLNTKEQLTESLELAA